MFSWIYPYSHAFPHTHTSALIPNQPPSSSPLLLPIIPEYYPSTYQAFISSHHVHPQMCSSSDPLVILFFLFSSCSYLLPIPSGLQQATTIRSFIFLSHPSLFLSLSFSVYTHMFMVQSMPTLSTRLFLCTQLHPCFILFLKLLCSPSLVHQLLHFLLVSHSNLWVHVWLWTYFHMLPSHLPCCVPHISVMWSSAISSAPPLPHPLLLLETDTP